MLHVIPSVSQLHGGPTQAIVSMEQALRAQGVDVETATTDDDGPGRRLRVPLGEPMLHEGGTRWYFAKRTEFYKASPGLARWLSREAGRFDLLHLHALFSFSTGVAARAARHAGVPYVVRPLGTLDPYGLTRRRPWLKALSMAVVERPILRHAAAVHFTSEAEAMEARKLGVAWREAIIPLGAPTAPRPADAGPFEPLRGGPCVLYLSRLDPKKNLESLLQACAMLLPEFPRLRLLVAGGGPAAYAQELKAQADRLGLARHIAWAGHLQGLQKSQAFAAADVFVLPSFSENFGIAAAEALAAGLPCVLAEGVAIAKEVAQAGAGSCVAPTPQALAAGLRRIMAEPQARAAMSANAERLAADRYSVNAMGRALRQLYGELVRQ